MLFLKQVFQRLFRFFFKKKSKKTSFIVQKSPKSFDSGHLGASVYTEIYVPSFDDAPFDKPFSLLLFNDGQDMEAVQLAQTLTELLNTKQIEPVLVVGLFPNDRIQEYGTARYLDYANRGQQSAAYAQFITQELIPYLEKNYRIHSNPHKRAVAGFSLGGLSAFDLVWNQPQLFGKVGVFSGALWWRSEAFKPEYPDADRIIHTMVERDATAERAQLQFWLQAGTNDEKEDRNNNGIIDAIDDTLDLIKILQKKGFHKKAMRYVEVEGGEHHPGTWKTVLPDFLKWAFGK